MATFDEMMTGGVVVLRERAPEGGGLPALVKAYASHNEKSFERAQEIVARFARESDSVVDELIVERRAEAETSDETRR